MLDNELVFSSAQAVTTTAISTNVIDLSVAKRNIGRGEPIHLVVSVGAAVTADGSATVAITLESSAAENMGTPTVLFTTGAVGKASLGAGAKPIVVAIPDTMPPTHRYLAVRYTVATGPLTAGTFYARLEMDPEGIDRAV